VRAIEIERLSMVALPFRPPAAQVRGRARHGRVRRGHVHLRGLDVQLPASELRLHGWYSTASGDANVRVQGRRVSFPDLHFALPQLPRGGGRGNLAYARAGRAQRVVASELDIGAEGARVAGLLDLEAGRAVRLGPSDLQYRSLDTRLIERLLPDFDSPVDGVLTGHVRLAGVAEAMNVDGWSTITERSGATSRIEAEGAVGNRPAGVFARDLALRFDPLRVSLVRGLAPELPVGGTVTGRATLNGPLNSRFAVSADVVHTNDGTGRSRVLANGQLVLAGGFSARALRLRFDPLQVALVRRFDPELPLDGVITGSATLTGAPASGLAADVALTHRGSTGVSTLSGDVDLTFREVLERINAELRVEPFALATAGRFLPSAGLGQCRGRSARAAAASASRSPPLSAWRAAARSMRAARWDSGATLATMSARSWPGSIRRPCPAARPRRASRACCAPRAAARVRRPRTR
jgi:hypothetical protein